MRISQWLHIGGFFLFVFYVFGMIPVSAQETAPSVESLELPEVVITGIDRSKIQRIIPKVTVERELAIFPASMQDLCEEFIREGERAVLIQNRQAEQHYLKALEINPTSSTAHLRLGDFYRSLNKYVEAATTYQNALKARANLPEAHYRLGLLYESQLQDLPQAMEHYQKYLELGGTDQRVKIWLRNAKRQIAETAE